MNQCVPDWDLDAPRPTTVPHLPLMCHPYTAPSPQLPAMSESDVAELTWEKGNLAMHGHHRHHGIAKPIPKYPSSSSSSSAAAAVPAACVKTAGTLESMINQAATCALPDSPLIPWPNLHPLAHYPPTLLPTSAEVAAAADAIVPVRKEPRVGGEQHAPNCTSQGSTSRIERHESTVVTLDTWEVTAAADDVGFTTASASPDEVGFTTTSSSPSAEKEGGAGSPETENTSVGGRPLALDDQYYVRRTQQTRKRSVAAVEGEEEEGKEQETVRSSISTKRSRASAVHNQSERKRRDRINERMMILQKLVPNSSKTDKASMLNEVIEYLKQLQAQVQMMSRMSSISQMLMPMTMPQLQMSMMAQMAQMAQMGMGFGMMDLNQLARHGHAGVPPIPRPTPLFPLVGDQQLAGAAALPDMFSAFPACPTQPMGLDAYKMAALYQQIYPQVQQANLKN